MVRQDILKARVYRYQSSKEANDTYYISMPVNYIGYPASTILYLYGTVQPNYLQLRASKKYAVEWFDIFDSMIETLWGLVNTIHPQGVDAVEVVEVNSRHPHLEQVIYAPAIRYHGVIH
jgi:hypothetical protein